MDSELKQKVSETVLEILREADMEQTTEYKIRKQASEILGVDLNVPELKQHVRHVVETFLVEQAEPETEGIQKDEQVEEEEEKLSPKAEAKEYDDDGDLILCRLSERRRVTLQDFKGKTLVSIREYYQKDGKELPSSKGISLTAEQWSSFKKNVPEIEKAIQKMESRLK